MVDQNQVFIRLLIALVIGGAIGLERQAHKRQAGLRTHILVCLGSCLIMLTSMYVFDIYKEQVLLDPARIAAGVITGIGFLGAGTIIRDREGVRGLTTAASLWVVAAIGLATGCGFYSAAIFTSLLTVCVLVVLRYMERIIFKDSQEKGGEL